MAARATYQEKRVIQGTIIYENDFFWITDSNGNRIGLTWRQDYADRLDDAIAVLEDIEHMEKGQR